MNAHFKVAAIVSFCGYVVSLITASFFPNFINLLVPTVFALIAFYIASRYIGIKDQRPNEQQGVTATSSPPPSVESGAGVKSVVEDRHSLEGNGQKGTLDQVWEPVVEYIHVIEEMIISEGQKNSLDDEIVEKTLSLLSRVNHLIPQLRELNDSNIDHKIQRLIFRDLNGAINPFLKLSGEAKRQNRRLLLDGLKDIQANLSLYVESIEKKDLLVLQSRIETIQRRYGSSN